MKETENKETKYQGEFWKLKIDALFSHALD